LLHVEQCIALVISIPGGGPTIQVWARSPTPVPGLSNQDTRERPGRFWLLGTDRDQIVANVAASVLKVLQQQQAGSNWTDQRRLIVLFVDRICSSADVIP
jgi:hypothetical protein